MLGIYHNFGPFCAIRWIENGSRQLDSCIRLQWFYEHHFGGVDFSAVALAGAAKTFGLAHMQPVGRSIDGTPEALRVHKGLQQHHGMAKGVLPINGKSLLAQRQNARTQIRDVPVGKDQETAVVGYTFQAIILMA